MTPVVIDNVSFAYGSNGRATPALEEVSLTVEPRDFLGIIGPNGGGKTTLLKLMLGLITPDRGSVRVFEQSPARARRNVGYVPQHAQMDTTVPATVLDVTLTGRLHCSPWGALFGRSHRQAALAALEQTGVAELADRPMGALSGGQRQRVLIARALASDAKLLLMDEPTTGVDIHAERGLIDLLHRLNESMPIVLVSHDVSFVSTHLKRVACLNRRVTCHPAHEISEDVISEMYHGPVRRVHHEDACPLHAPGCDHGCPPPEDAHAHGDDEAASTSTAAASTGRKASSDSHREGDDI